MMTSFARYINRKRSAHGARKMEKFREKIISAIEFGFKVGARDSRVALPPVFSGTCSAERLQRGSSGG